MRGLQHKDNRMPDAAAQPWIQSYDPEASRTINYESEPLYAYLEKAAHTFPKRKAIVFRNWKLTYAGLQRKVDAMAAELQRHGLKKGDRVAIMLPNLPQTIISFWAVLRSGCVAVMTNPLYMETELLHQIKDSGAKSMITLDLLWDKINPLREQLGVEKYFITRISDCLAFPLNLLYTFKTKREGKWKDIPHDGVRVFPWLPLTKGKQKPTDPHIAPKKDLAILQYTGGTTGVSKGCMLSHWNVGCNVQQMASMLYALSKDTHHTILGLLPYFHVYGLTVCIAFATSLNATLAPIPRYVPKDVLEAISKLRPTIFPGAPSVYMSLLHQKEIANYDISSIMYCLSGSAPMPMEGITRFKELAGAEIIEGYGLTEASPVTHLNPLKGKRKPGTIGLPFPDTDVRIVDMEVGTVQLKPGQVGEMIIKGPQVMLGYWNRPDETASTLRNDWLYTGDIATMDEEGYFSIVDRKKDMIIQSGYNVYPREIDEVLIQHPKVKEAVAVGVPHPSRGEIIKAYVVPADGETIERSEIIAFCRKKLANYKVPKQVELREDLPKTIVGKVLRRSLRAEEEEKLQEQKKAKA